MFKEQFIAQMYTIVIGCGILACILAAYLIKITIEDFKNNHRNDKK